MNIQKNCIICEKPIFQQGHMGVKSYRRPMKAITCSKKCSKAYTRAYQHLRKRVKNET